MNEICAMSQHRAHIPELSAIVNAFRKLKLCTQGQSKYSGLYFLWNLFQTHDNAS